ncbi:MAG: hypothetical protein KDE27_05360 [Planctomycetes bacterium]|nr:hypothetical protein [Planctomycetota bacterium]
MDYLTATTKRLRIPRAVVSDATTALLLLFDRFGNDADLDHLWRQLPLAHELLGARCAPVAGAPVIGWIRELVAVAGGSVRIRESLLGTGLREPEIVPFVSAFVQHAVACAGEDCLERLVARVPGLGRLSSWPEGRATVL